MNIDSFTNKYPFLIDPIVLLVPQDNITIDDLKNKKRETKYPNIYKQKKGIKKVRKDISLLSDQYINRFSGHEKEAFEKRISDFLKVCDFIENFYNEDESHKFDFIIDYFGIDLDYIKQKFDDTLFQDQIKEFFSGLVDIFPEKTSNLPSGMQGKDFFCEFEDIKIIFETVLDRHNIRKYWKIRESNVVSMVHTSFFGKGGEFHVPFGDKREYNKILSLAIHEMEGHSVQFSPSTDNFLYWGSFRFSKSEEILEGRAVILERSFNVVFGISKLDDYLGKWKERVDLFYKKDYINYALFKSDIVRNRTFRGFKNIDKYANLKDMIYIQGFFRVFELLNKYKNAIDLILHGAVNEEYIRKFGKEGDGRYGLINYLKNTYVFNI